MGLETVFGHSYLTTRLDEAVNWGRKYSFFQYPFVTACCGMEFMSVWASTYDIARFGAEYPRFSPRQADVLFVVGTISHKMAPVLKRIYNQMMEPKWVIAMGACAGDSLVRAAREAQEHAQGDHRRLRGQRQSGDEYRGVQGKRHQDGLPVRFPGTGRIHRLY